MTEMLILGTIASLVGLIVAVITPILRLNTTITKLNTMLDNEIEGGKKRNQILEKHEQRLDDHDRRIVVLETSHKEHTCDRK